MNKKRKQPKKRSLFISFKIKPMVIVALLMLFSFGLSYSIVKVSTLAQPKSQYVIVLDAGHGGLDGGSIGCTTQVKESDLNLNVVKKLQPYLEKFGFQVVLTRKGNDNFSDNKVKDMEQRESIINSSTPNLVVSIHMNSFPTSDQKGAQVYYQEGAEESQKLATSIQKQFQEHLDTNREANHGDYYILKCSKVPTVLIECGYLSNPEDEANLIQEEYQEKLAYQIFCGIIKYLNIRKN